MENKTSNNLFGMDRDQFNRIVAVCIAVVTLIATVMAYLQGDASARDDRANRDSKRYSIEAFGRQVSGDARVNFDFNTAYQAYYEMSLLSASAESRDDIPAAKRYQTMMNETRQLSPMLNSPYFTQDSNAEPNIARYEADTYLVDITRLRENFLAASAVKEGWDYKANTYILLLTMLAVALFLFGLSSTISGPLTRWIFSGGGAAITLVTVIWAAQLYAKPVFDLRQQGNAIEDYAQGVGMAHQSKHVEAQASFDKAVQAYPQYTNALYQRGLSAYSLGENAKAIADYEAARKAGDSSGNLAGELAYVYYLEGRFADAIQMNQVALKASPGELWVQFDLALSNLAAGDLDQSKAEYSRGMEMVTKQVADAKSAGKEPPSNLWWGMLDAADSLEALVTGLDDPSSKPAADKLASPEKIQTEAPALITSLKSLALSLEYTGLPPKEPLLAQITPLQFVEPEKDEAGVITGYAEPSEVFAAGIDEFAVKFDYSGMKDGQDVIFKLYINGAEDPSWRILEAWSLGESGSAEIPVSYAYSDTFTFQPGEYTVELYVNYQLAKRGSFTVSD
ncbi:MAG: tetratricopeptide repeat protein [Leptolinea sp.]